MRPEANVVLFILIVWRRMPGKRRHYSETRRMTPTRAGLNDLENDYYEYDNDQETNHDKLLCIGGDLMAPPRINMQCSSQH